MESTTGGLQDKAAMHAMTIKAEGMLKPLLEVDDEDDSISSDEKSQYSNFSGASSISVKVKQNKMQKLKTGLVALGLGVGVVASVGAMILTPVTAVFIMGGVLIANVPYSAVKEYRIIKLPALRSLNDKLREEANKLEDEVGILSEEIDLLKPDADRTASAEQELKDIAATNHFNVDKFISLVKENEIVIAKMRDYLRQCIVQDVIRIVMSSDKNCDGKLCKVETKMLVLKISLALKVYGVGFDEEKFYHVMREDPSVAQTIKIVKRLIPGLEEEDEDDEETNDMYDMFHMTGGESSLTGSTHTFSSAQEALSLSIVKPPPPRRESVRRQSQLELRRSSVRKEKEQPTRSKGSAEGVQRKRDKFIEWFKK